MATNVWFTVHPSHHMIVGRKDSFLVGLEYCKACGWVLRAAVEELEAPCRIVPFEIKEGGPT